jgi:hypothetical protein
VSSPYYTEYGQRCDAVLSGRITSIVMSRSDQLGLRCIVELNYSRLSTRLQGASVTRVCALDTCRPSCVPEAARPFFIPVIHSPLRAVGYVVAPKLSSREGEVGGHVTASEPTSTGKRGPKLRNMWQRRSSHLGEVEPGTMEHVAAPEPTSTVRRGPELRNTWQRRSSTQQGGEFRDHGTCGNTRAQLSK